MLRGRNWKTYVQKCSANACGTVVTGPSPYPSAITAHDPLATVTIQKALPTTERLCMFKAFIVNQIPEPIPSKYEEGEKIEQP